MTTFYCQLYYCYEILGHVIRTNDIDTNEVIQKQSARFPVLHVLWMHFSPYFMIFYFHTFPDVSCAITIITRRIRTKKRMFCIIEVTFDNNLELIRQQGRTNNVNIDYANQMDMYRDFLMFMIGKSVIFFVHILIIFVQKSACKIMVGIESEVYFMVNEEKVNIMIVPFCKLFVQFFI